MAFFLAELINPILLLLGGVWLFTKWKKTQKKWHFWLAIISIILSFFNFYRVVYKYNEGQEKEKLKFEKTKKDTENFQKLLGEKIVASTPLDIDSLIFYDNVLQILVPKNFVVVEQKMDKVNFLSLSLDRSYQVVIAKVMSDNATLDEVVKQSEESMLVKQPNSKISVNASLPGFTEDCQIKDYVLLDNSNNMVSQGSIVYIKKGDVFYTICYVSLLPDKQIELTKEIHRRISLK